jgi:transposase-like protein
MAYSNDLKQRVLEFVAAGGGKSEAARRFSVARSTVFVWLDEPEDHVPGKPGPKTGRKIDRDKLRQAVQEQPDLMLKELARRFDASINGISCSLKAMGMSRKKNAVLRPSLHR